MKSLHNHGASRSGKLSESLLRKILTDEGFLFLREKNDFKTFYGKTEASERMKKSMYLDAPKWWEEEAQFFTPKGGKARFFVDGYLPEFDLRVEMKYTNAHGTTEEKVMFDLEKIRDGVYSDKKLLYVFFGPLANQQKVFRLFKAKVRQIDPDEKKIKVIIDDSKDLTFVKKHLYSLRKKKV